jgi:hypothetical protein
LFFVAREFRRGAADARGIATTRPYPQREPGVIENSIFPMFFMSDALRRSLGWLLDAAGLAPHEASWHIVLKQSDLQLRRYGQQAETAGPVLIVPAPIKRPYIFDLLPEYWPISLLKAEAFSRSKSRSPVAA